MERGKGVGARRVGQGGGARGWGKGGARGWNLYLNEVFLQNRYRNFRLGCCNSCYDTKLYTKSQGISDFGFIAIVMTSRSRKNVIISPKKVRKQDVQEISSNYLCKKEQPCWPHLRISNSIYEAMAAYFH